MKKIFIAVALFFAALTFSYAQEINFTASVDKNSIALNEYFVYSLIVSGDVLNLPDPQIGDTAGFKTYSSGKKQNISIINGKKSGSVTYLYTFMPKKTGKFVIPPAKIKYKKQEYATDPINIEVTDAKKIDSVTADAPQSRNNAGAAGSAGARQSSQPQRKAFVKAGVSKKTAYINEKITYTFSFYTNADLASNPEYNPPSFTGFWNDSTKPKNRYEVIDGSNYSVHELETVLYPVESGKVTIDPARLKIAMVDFSNSAAFDDIFSAFTNMRQVKERVLETEPVTISVLDFPQENKPPAFKGAVGNFKITSAIDKTQGQTNEPFTVTVKVTGQGNFKSVSEIDLPLSGEFKVYDTIVSNVSENSKEFKIVFVPLTPGEKTIPGAKLFYFNPDKKAYSVSETGQTVINVSGNAVIGEIVSRSHGVVNVRDDIRYNKQIGDLKQYEAPLLKNKLFYLLFIPFILLFTGSAVYRIYRIKISANPLARLKAQAAETSLRCVRAAESKSDKSNDCAGFYELVHEALTASITARTGVRSDNLSLSEILSNLRKENAGENIINKVEGIFSKLNFYKFASVKADEKALNDLLENAKEIINDLRK